jgi:two-component system sensor histidine kinase MprB
MSLRGRITALVAAVVAVLLVAIGAGQQLTAARVLLDAVDQDLVRIAAAIERDPRGVLIHAGPGRERAGGAAGLVQLTDAEGRAVGGRGPMASRTDDELRIPVDDEVLALARPTGGADQAHSASLRTVVVDGFSLRVLAVPFAPGLVLQVARPIDEIEAALVTLRGRTAVVTLLGALLAALLAWWVAGRAIRPVTVLTERVESIRGAGDLTRRLEVRGEDEVARLAVAFNGMLGRLEAARALQEQLTADASHELRTPLTSLRTNIEVLAGSEDRLDPVARASLLADLLGQVEELTAMVDGLVDLARVDAVPDASEDLTPVDLSRLVVDVIASAARRSPQRAADLRLDLPDGARESLTVRGDRHQLTLAVNALLDNAVKYAPTGPIEVTLAHDPAGSTVLVQVRDHGPGVAPEYHDAILDRFFRTPEARSQPGAGLGLALVARVARAHGGRVVVHSAEPQAGPGAAQSGDAQGLVVALELPSR